MITTYDPSIGGILLGNNNESDNPYFCFMNPFLSFKTRVFFSGEKLESCSYVLISLIFVYYVMNHSAYIFLYFLLDSFLGKDWWYTSHVTRTRMAIAKLFALHINSTRIVTITFLKFLKLTGNLLLKFLIKREICQKIVQLNRILIVESKYLLKVTYCRS